MKKNYRVLNYFLVITLLVLIAATMYIAVTPQETTSAYTEFYILNATGNASEYPTDLQVGERGNLTVGIANHEQQPTKYTLILTMGEQQRAKRVVTIGDNQTWEERFFIKRTSVDDTKLRLLLYKGENVSVDEPPYRSLRLWISTSELRPGSGNNSVTDT